MSTTAERLLSTLRAVAPVSDIGIGTRGDPSSVRVSYSSTPTPSQGSAVASALASFDWSDAAQATWELAQNPERKTLLDAAAQAVADLDSYLALASPTNAQVAAQVRRLSQNQRAVIKRLVQLA
jgi:hypothetical protein